MIFALLSTVATAGVTELHDENFEEFYARNPAVIVLFHRQDAAARRAFDEAAAAALARFPQLVFAAFDLTESEHSAESFETGELPSVLTLDGDLHRSHPGLTAPGEIGRAVDVLLSSLPVELRENEELKAFVSQPVAVLFTLNANTTNFEAKLRGLALHHHPLPFAFTFNNRFRHPDHPDTASFVITVYRHNGEKHHTVAADELLPHTFSAFIAKHSVPAVIELGPDSTLEDLKGHSVLAVLVSDEGHDRLFRAFEHMAYAEEEKIGFFWWHPSRPPPQNLRAWLSPRKGPSPPAMLVVEQRGERVLHHVCHHQDSHGLRVCLHHYLSAHEAPTLSSQSLPVEETVDGVKQAVGLNFHELVIDFPGHVVVALTVTGCPLSAAMQQNLRSIAANAGHHADLRLVEMDCHFNHVEELLEAHCPGLYVFPAEAKTHPLRCHACFRLGDTLECIEKHTGIQFPWLETHNEL